MAFSEASGELEILKVQGKEQGVADHTRWMWFRVWDSLNQSTMQMIPLQGHWDGRYCDLGSKASMTDNSGL